MKTQKSGGYSRTARNRRQRAGLLSQRMHQGERDAAFRLLQRRRALAGIAKGGGHWRVVLMNQARLAKRQQRLSAEAIATERERQKARSTVKLDDKALSALRARYGRGGFSAEVRQGECMPVMLGTKCPACGWQWGSREPHVIAVL